MNLILQTDSYKLNHWNQYPPGTEKVYSYFEARSGALFPETVFFGLTPLLRKLEERITLSMVEEARAIAMKHFGSESLFNYDGWRYIAEKLKGELPLEIRAVDEGSVVPVSNVLMTVENTDPNCAWLTNHMETLLSQIWYPSTVATLSYNVKKLISEALHDTSDNISGLDFMLHDFGCRGASSMESSAIGGLAHLVNFNGTDTVPALMAAREFYQADMPGFSVPATEHSIMTAEGVGGEKGVVARLLNQYPTGILSVVADSYNIYTFVEQFVGVDFKDQILAREGVFVIRPDSVNDRHRTPVDQICWILESLSKSLPSWVNERGYRVITPKVRVLWGDGLDYQAIKSILTILPLKGWSVENIACFGMGGGLLQKVNRDTQRCAFKCSAQKRNGQWHNVIKNPVGSDKKSKSGRMSLVYENGKFATVPYDPKAVDYLRLRFIDGTSYNNPTFDQVRETVRNGKATLK